MKQIVVWNAGTVIATLEGTEAELVEKVQGLRATAPDLVVAGWVRGVGFADLTADYPQPEG